LVLGLPFLVRGRNLELLHVGAVFLKIVVVTLKDPGFNFWNPSQPPDTRGDLLNEMLSHRIGWLIVLE
jgi:hypothetical protein